jgi:hypothetical protein
VVVILKKRPFQGQAPLFILGMYRREVIPLEEYVVNAGSSEGNLLCVVGSLGQNSDPR